MLSHPATNPYSAKIQFRVADGYTFKDAARLRKSLENPSFRFARRPASIVSAQGHLATNTTTPPLGFELEIAGHAHTKQNRYSFRPKHLKEDLDTTLSEGSGPAKPEEAAELAGC